MNVQHVEKSNILIYLKKKYKCQKKGCKNYQRSAFADTFFYRKKLKCNQILQIAYLWICGSTTKTIQIQTGHSSKTLTSYLKKFKILIAGMISEDDDMFIGGKGIVVELDETLLLGKIKSHRGHGVEGVTIMGGVERTKERKVLFFKIIKRKDKDTIQEVIEKYVHPDSIVNTDQLSSYNCLENSLGMIHNTVNHSKYFIDPITKTHTNTIEGTWNGMKEKTPRNNRNNGRVELNLYKKI
jgi:transposase-like protein